jgi:hypothetical protein
VEIRHNHYDYSLSLDYSVGDANRADAIKIFETVEAFCHNKGLGHLGKEHFEDRDAK